MANDEIKELLAKCDARPFYFGGESESYFWRVAKIEDGSYCDIFAERVFGRLDGQTIKNYYFVNGKDRNAVKSLYESFVIDFVMYYYSDWRFGFADDVFEVVASQEDEGLNDILRIFGKKYVTFLSDVLFWYGIAVETAPNSDGVFGIMSNRRMTDDERLVKLVINRLSKSEPITFSYKDTFYSWQFVRANDEIWYYRSSYYCRGNYDYNADEYGHISERDVDAVEALRDAVCSCSYLDGWGILERDSDPNDQLEIVNLTLEDLE